MPIPLDFALSIVSRMDQRPSISSSAVGVAISTSDCSSRALLDLVDDDFFNCSALRSAICSLIVKPPCEEAGDERPSEIGDIGDFARTEAAVGLNFGAETFVLSFGGVGGTSPRVGRLGVVGLA
jgi:hypothetical protein